MSGGVTPDEWLARYILRKEHIRSDGTLKPDPFIPYKHVELSVTRHLNLAENEIWATGQTIASQIGKKLLGRGDAQSSLFSRSNLVVKSAPTPENPNHANILGWPLDKQSQKEIALELVKKGGVDFRPFCE